ncbi:hypothetical protein INR49_006428 [Caranx melampygus]|nr:hypothetical protein INR49_006428 [Caranx melampygus]
MASSLLLLLLLSLLSSVTSLSPRVSFTLDSEDRPLIHLKLPDVHNTTTLLLSDDASPCMWGRETPSSRWTSVDWRPSSSEIHNCEIKGKNATVDCPNFVRVLQLLNSTHLYTCGSFAFSPGGRHRMSTRLCCFNLSLCVLVLSVTLSLSPQDIQTFTLVPLGEGKGRCPFNPSRGALPSPWGALHCHHQRLQRCQTSDLQTPEHRPASRCEPRDVGQLTGEPTFVSSSLDAVEKKLYFFFSEVGREFSFVDQLQIARVAQVCKDDVGGQRTLQKKWTSFAKAPLLCQSPRQLPFNVLQDVFTLTGDGGHAPDTLFYGIFTSQWSSSPHSAVCVFRLQDVKTVFAGSYRTFNMETHQWSPLLGNHPYLGKCGLGGATDTELAEVKKSFLTSNPVQRCQTVRSWSPRTSKSGLLHRVVLFDGGARVVEEVQVFTQPQLVKSMVLSPTKGVLYVGTSEGVTGIPVANCSAYRTCGQCVLARDPLCGWSLSRRVCSRVEGGDENMVQDLENSSVDERCTYRCEVEEDGSRRWSQATESDRWAPPRSIRPSPMADDHVSNNKDEPFEDITTEGPLVSEPSGDPEDEETRSPPI